jgi:polysaccharide biosynthesis/export protein
VVRIKFVLAIVTAIFFFAPSPLAAQLAPQDKDWNERISELSVLGRSIADYRLGPGDLIEINVFGVEEFNSQIRISATGEINLPYLGRLKVEGLSAAQLEERLKELLDGRYIKNPQLFVYIREYKAHEVFVLGAVNQPGQYQMTQRLTLIDIIAMAGGLDLLTADDFAMVQRRNPETGGDQATVNQLPEKDLEIIRVDLKELLESGSLQNNIVLRAGDVVQIPARKIRRFFILGDVNGPGAFDLPDDQNLLVSQALAWAGGPSKTAKMNSGMLVRYDNNGGRSEMEVKLKDILAGKKEDFVIRENDIIFIPGSGFKTIGYGLMGALVSAPATATSRTLTPRGSR